MNGEEINRKYYENPTESDSFTVKLEKESVDGSPVELMVHAVDRAGNSTVRKEKTLYRQKIADGRDEWCDRCNDHRGEMQR